MNQIPLAHGDMGSLIFFVLLVILTIALVCVGVIVLAWRLTKKINGSKKLFWGSLLGVAVAQLARLPFGYFSILDIFGSLLLGAAMASVISYLINLWSYKKRREGAVIATDQGMPE